MNRPHVTPSAKRRTYVIDEPQAVAPWAASLRSRLKEAFGSDELGPRALDLLFSSIIALPLKSYAGRLSRFAELCHDSENISPLEATTVTVVQTRADRSKEAFNKQTVFMWKDTVAEGCNTVRAWCYTTFGHVQLLFRLSQHSTVSKTEEGYIKNSTFSFSVWIVPNCANSESRMTSAMATFVGDGAPKVEISADTFTILPPNADYGAYAKHESGEHGPRTHGMATEHRRQ
eukprot:jgi/Tetstr1/446705/TSEL_034194.t1